LALANLQSRLGWWEGPPFGGGEWTFCYRGDTASFSQALAAFAAIRAPALDLVIQDGPETNGILGQQTDWAFTVWIPASWNHLFNNPKSVFEADSGTFHKSMSAMNGPRLRALTCPAAPFCKRSFLTWTPASRSKAPTSS
jgi:hypothetical protein